VALALIAMWHGRGLRVSDLWPLDLSRPGSWIVDWQLAEVGRDPDLCRRALSQAELEGSPTPDRVNGGGCGWANAVRMTGAGGARLVAGPLTCGVAAALALWIAHEVQPVALQHLGVRVAAVEQLGTYACRNIRTDSGTDPEERSEHATANAIDIRGFVLADGRRITIKGHWGGDTAEGRFLLAAQRGTCRYFRVSLGPAYNAAHADHFHLDRGSVRYCRPRKMG
jgi:hypothetical protein